MRRITLQRKRSGEHTGVPRHPQAERGLSAHPQRGATRNERIDELLGHCSIEYLYSITFTTVTVKLVNVINCQMWLRRSVMALPATATRARLDSRVSRRLVPSRVRVLSSPTHSLFRSNHVFEQHQGHLSVRRQTSVPVSNPSSNNLHLQNQSFH
jgi:hypothetical protein